MPTKGSWPRRIAMGLGVLLALVAAGVGFLFIKLRHPLPTGVIGAAAGNLAHDIETSVNLRGWAKTGAVRFTFGGRNEHLWDRWRAFDRVRMGDAEVLLDIGKKSGRAYRGGREIEGADRDKLVERAYRSWINDTFWINPFAKLFDEGTSRALTEVDGHPALLVSYSSGGVTPGDRYLYLLDDNHRPIAWRLWVSILPIKGIEISWDGWTELPTGALISTVHTVAGLGVHQPSVTGLAGAESLAGLMPGPDPFAPLVAAATH